MLEEIFTEAVHQYFNPLAERYGLKETFSTEDNVTNFENDKVCLYAHFDSRRSFELGVNIVNKNPDFPCEASNCFSLALILEFKTSHQSKAVGGLQTSNSQFIPEAVKILAYSTETYATNFLEGNQESFRELKAFQETQCSRYESEMKLWYARRAVEKAWTKKDYAGVIKAYKPLENELTSAEKKKLYYCEKML